MIYEKTCKNENNSSVCRPFSAGGGTGSFHLRECVQDQTGIEK
jgi:hypothetical protein